MNVSVSQIGRNAALAVVYILAARAGLELGTVAGFATLVWPATGIALAALLLGGYGLWPGIFVGALVANVWNGAPIPVSLGIATGNTLEALVGAFLIRRVPDFRFSLDRVRDAIAIIGLAAGLSTLVSATIGVASLELGGLLPPGEVSASWRAWWLGDAIGALLVAPAILVWVNRPREFPPTRRLVEAAALTASVIIAGMLVFVLRESNDVGVLSRAYILFPILIWAAIRFGQVGAVSATLLASVIAVWGTVIGHGSFVGPTLHASLYSLQTFVGVTAATFLILGASTSERERVTSDLGTAHDVAANANRAKADFLAVMSHELRTPLNAIAGYSEILALGLAGPLTEKQGDAVRRIQRSQEHLLSLIEDVLTFAKIEAGSSTLAPRAVRVADAFEEIEPLVQPELLRKRITLERGADSGLLVHADPNKLRQILLNIVGNAIKFTGVGGSIILGASPRGDAAVMTVTDTGIGVPPDKLSQVFEPFFQVAGGNTREYSGVGLGLAIARDLARAMGGEIQFDSELGRGSVVSVMLPANMGRLTPTGSVTRP